MKKNLILIGMPAAGKSTVGVILAKYMNMDFLDTDILIQNKKGKKLSEIIEENGIDEFCRLEEEIVSAIDCNSTIIATGGSVVYGEKAMAHLKKNGKIVYLETSLEVVEKRLENLEQRGVVNKNNFSVADLYNERVPLYEKWADMNCSTSTGRPEDVVANIIKSLGNNF